MHSSPEPARVYGALSSLLNLDGQLGAAPAALDAHFDDRAVVRLARQYRDRQGEVATDGRAVVVSAGPPGAGKSSALGSLDLSGYRMIDADVAKDLVLARALELGLLGYRKRFTLPDGDCIHPRELAAHVHAYSTRVADLVRRLSLDAGENVVIEGTLNWTPLCGIYIDELHRAGYEQLEIVSVDVDADVASARARNRWWEGRESDRGRDFPSGSVFGGRFVPEIAISACYLGPDGTSSCAANARLLAERAADELGNGVLHEYRIDRVDSEPVPVEADSEPSESTAVPQ